jgi:hypothetical protein
MIAPIGLQNLSLQEQRFLGRYAVVVCNMPPGPAGGGGTTTCRPRMRIVPLSRGWVHIRGDGPSVTASVPIRFPF